MWLHREWTAGGCAIPIANCCFIWLLLNLTKLNNFSHLEMELSAPEHYCCTLSPPKLIKFKGGIYLLSEYCAPFCPRTQIHPRVRAFSGTSFLYYYFISERLSLLHVDR